jgi:metal-dependent amidase/aminoacylase/carboxypeptidase family protein
VELVGADQVVMQGPPLTGSEDFAFMLEKVPGSYLLIGNGEGEGPGGGCMATTRATTSTTRTSPSAAPTGCCWPSAS